LHETTSTLEQRGHDTTLLLYQPIFGA